MTTSRLRSANRDKCRANSFELGINLLIGLIQPKQEIQRHLIIPASSRMQFLPRLADPLNQRRLDHHVNIFQALIEFEIGPLRYPARSISNPR